tara:strand:- start:389 stop:493 length:105 start_codon:yes stop_codon:yes gene_type:complete
MKLNNYQVVFLLFGNNNLLLNALEAAKNNIHFNY